MNRCGVWEDNLDWGAVNTQCAWKYWILYVLEITKHIVHFWVHLFIYFSCNEWTVCPFSLYQAIISYSSFNKTSCNTSSLLIRISYEQNIKNRKTAGLLLTLTTFIPFLCEMKCSKYIEEDFRRCPRHCSIT